MLACLLVPAAIVLAIALQGATPAEPAEPAAILRPGPYADFRFEQVGVGVRRLIDDGVGHRPGDWSLFRGTQADLVAVEPNGSVLTCCDRPNVLIEARDEAEIHRLGDPEPAAAWSFPKVGIGDIANMTVAEDGTLWVAGAGVASVVEGEWTWARRHGYSETVAVGTDGTAWASLVSERPPPSSGPVRLVRISNGKARVLTAGEGLPKAVRRWDGQITAITSTPNGHVWVGVGGQNAKGAGGLLHFDGKRWKIIRPLGRGVAARVYGVTSAPDGTVWVYLSADARKGAVPKLPTAHLARFDGEDWTVFDEEDGVPSLRRRWIDTDIGVPMRAGADGTLWLAPPIGHGCSRLMRFASAGTTAYLGESSCVRDLELDTDGRAWVSVVEWTESSGSTWRAALYLIEP